MAVALLAAGDLLDHLPELWPPTSCCWKPLCSCCCRPPPQPAASRKEGQQTQEEVQKRSLRDELETRGTGKKVQACS